MQKWHKDGKLYKAHNEKMGGKNINKAYHSFLCALTRDNSDGFFFIKDRGSKEKASDIDDVNEDDDEYQGEDSNTSE